MSDGSLSAMTGDVSHSATRNARVAGGRVFAPGVRLVSVLALVALWELESRRASPALFASFGKTMSALWTMIRSGAVFGPLGSSALVLFWGFGVALAVCIPLGFIAGRVPRLEAMLSPYISMSLALPVISVAPVVLFAVGLGSKAAALVVFLFGSPQVLANAIVGSQSADPKLVEMARSFQVRRVRQIVHVVMPSALPATFTGVKLGLGHAIQGMLVAELLVDPAGLGGSLSQFIASSQPADAFAVIIVLGFASVCLLTLIRWAERSLLFWVDIDR